MALITRAQNGAPLSVNQMDGNLLYLENLALSGGGTGSGVTIKGDFTSNNEAIVNGLVTGDYYRYYDTDKDIYTVAIVKEEADLHVNVFNSDTNVSNLTEILASGTVVFEVQNIDARLLIAKNTDNNKSYYFDYDYDANTFNFGTVSNTGLLTSIATNVPVIAGGDVISGVTYSLPLLPGLRDSGTFSATASGNNGDTLQFNIIVVNSVIVNIVVIYGGNGYDIGDTVSMHVPNEIFADTVSSSYSIELTVSELEIASNYTFQSFIYTGEGNFFALGIYDNHLSKVFNISSTGVCTLGYSMKNIEGQNNNIQSIINYNGNYYSIFISFDYNSTNIINSLETIEATDYNMLSYGNIPGINSYKVFNAVVSVIEGSVYGFFFAMNEDLNVFFPFIGKINIVTKKVTFIRMVEDIFNFPGNIGPLCLYEKI